MSDAAAGQPSKLRIERQVVPGAALVRLSGVIDAELANEEPIAPAGAVLVLDLDGVTRITSFGVREWLRALTAVRPAYLAFIHCRPTLVAQFNSVAGFACDGAVVSLFVPYVCVECDHTFDRFVDLRDGFELVEQEQPPTLPCPSCGEPAELDDIPENYFSFLRGQGRPRVPELASRLIAGKIAEAAGVPLRVDKQVQGNVTALWLSGALDQRARLGRVLDGVEGTAVLELSLVSAVDDKGAARLCKLLESDDFQLYLARVRADGLLALTRSSGDRLTGTLVSMLADGFCIGCNAVRPGELSGVGLTRFLEGAQERPECTVCRTPIDAVVPADVRAVAARLRCASVPLEVRTYLEDHPMNQRPDARLRAEALSARPTTGGFEIIRPLGRGGMAEVFLARQTGIHGFEKRVVVKRILGALADQEDMVKLFLQEARVAARISHPNVVQIFDLGEDKGHYFIAMEYVKGWDLMMVVRAARRLGSHIPVGISCRLVAEVCAGLQAAHSCRDENGTRSPVVHRDVSPHNVLLSTEGDVKLTDFGISKVADSALHTKTGMVMGKVPYMAPEQLVPDFGPIDHRVDTYQAGLLLLELLLGRAPFHRENEFNSASAVAKNEIPDLRDVRSDVPDGVRAIVRKAVQARPDDRFQTAQELQLALENAIVESGTGPVTSSHVAEWLTKLVDEGARAGCFTDPAFTPMGADGSATEATELVTRPRRS